MLANPYDPSRDLSPNLPTTSCRGQEQLTHVFGGRGTPHPSAVAAAAAGQCYGAAAPFKSEFDDDGRDNDADNDNDDGDCCDSKLQQLQASPPVSMAVVVAGDDYHRGGPLQVVPPCKQEDASPVHRHHYHHHHHHHHHNIGHQSPAAAAVVGYRHRVSPESPTPPPPPPSLPLQPPPTPDAAAATAAAYLRRQSPADARPSVRPDREPAEVNLCDGCGLKILDRYYLFAVDKRWHAACLQCSRCARTLATDVKCFYRDGNIYCKSDYQR